MKYVIKNKIVSFGGSSTVQDDAGNDLFFVKGKIFTFTRKKFIQTVDGETKYIVRNKFFHILLPKVFILDPEGNILLTIKKHSLFSFRQSFDILSDKFNITIQGDFIGRHYDILDNGVPVAHVRRNFNLVKDSFWLETEMTENAPFYIAFVIALDNYYDKIQEESSNY